MEPTTFDVVMQQTVAILLQYLLPILATAIAVEVARLVGVIRRIYRERVNSDIQANIDALVVIGVQAAEQSGLKGHIEDVGIQKLAYATRYVQSEARKLGFGHLVDNTEDLQARIESALREGWHQGVSEYLVEEDAA